MGISLGDIVTPAIVSFIVSTLISLRGEKLKAHRDSVGSVFDAARLAVQESMDAGSTYFVAYGNIRTESLQTRLFTSEREVRCAVSEVIEWAPTMDPPVDVTQIVIKSDEFIDLLLAADYGQDVAIANSSHALKIAEAGTTLRHELARARKQQISTWLKRDPIQRLIVFLSVQMGPPQLR